MPFASTRYRNFLPLFPRAIESFDLSGFDLVLSTSHAVAKGCRPAPGAFHLAYIHTPMRYVWDQFDAYFGPGRASLPVRAGVPSDSLHQMIAELSARLDRLVTNGARSRLPLRPPTRRPMTSRRCVPPPRMPPAAPRPARP